MADLKLTGISGTTYEFWLAPVNPKWLVAPGLYVFVGPIGKVLYIGETGNFATRQPGPAHEKWAFASLHGSIAIFSVITSGTEATRKAAERDLIAAYDPPCNIQNPFRRALSLRREDQLWGRSGLAPLTPRKKL